MAFATSTATVQPVEEAPVAPSSSFPSSEVALLMMGALAGASMTKAARKQYRAMTRKAAWKALGYKVKGLFNKEFRQENTVAGMNFWLFLALVVLGAAIGFAIFGVTGFLILLGIGIIIYLLLNRD